MSKTKISVTVDAALVEQVDELDIDASRSEIVEMALRRWLGNRKLASLNSAVEAYYRGLTTHDRDEDAEWGSIAAEAFDETWE